MRAYYDPAKDEIVGCEPGTFAWYHEERHRQQYKNGIAHKLDMMHIYLYYKAIIFGFLALVFLGFIEMLLTIGVVMFPHILGLTYLELDANIAGYINFRKNRRKTQ